MEWVDGHCEDADFEEELFIQDEKPKMSMEEAIRKAKELQQEVRKKKNEEEKKSNEQRERERIKSTKVMQEAQKKLEE